MSTIEELEEEFKAELFDFVQDIKTYDPNAQLLSSHYFDRVVKFMRWFIHFIKDNKAVIVQKAQDFEDRITTLETQADQARTILQDHEQRISNLEGGV